MNNLRLNIAWTLLAQLVEKGIPFVAGIILVRYLDAQDYAGYAFIIISTLSLAAFASVGIQVVATKLERMIADGRSDTANNLHHLQRYALLQTSAVIVCAAVGAPLLFPNTNLLNIILMSGASFCLAISALPQARLVAHRNFKDYAIVSILSGLTLSIGVFFACIHASSTPAVYGFFLSSVVTYAGFRHYYGGNRFSFFRKYSTGEPVSYSLVLRGVAPLALSSAITSITNWGLARILVSSASTNPEIFAAFAIGMQWYALVQFLPSVINRVTFPDILSQEINNKESRSAALKLHTRQIRFSIFSALATAAVIGLVSVPLSWLYGAPYVTPALIITFAAISVISAPINVYGNVIVAQSKEVGWLYCTLLWSCVVLIATLIFRDLGTYAAVVSLSLGGFVHFLAARSLSRT